MKWRNIASKRPHANRLMPLEEVSDQTEWRNEAITWTKMERGGRMCMCVEEMMNTLPSKRRMDIYKSTKDDHSPSTDACERKERRNLFVYWKSLKQNDDCSLCVYVYFLSPANFHWHFQWYSYTLAFAITSCTHSGLFPRHFSRSFIIGQFFICWTVCVIRRFFQHTHKHISQSNRNKRQYMSSHLT